MSTEKLREAMSGPLHQALHTLDVRIADLNAEGCHCNLVTQVALDAILALPEVVALLADDDQVLDQWLDAETKLTQARKELAAAMKVVEAARAFRVTNNSADFHTRMSLLDAAVDALPPTP